VLARDATVAAWRLSVQLHDFLVGAKTSKPPTTEGYDSPTRGLCCSSTKSRC